MRKVWIWILGIAALGAIAAVVWWRDGPVAVSAVTPTRGPAVDAIYATGTVEPTVMLPIAPRVAGRLVELNVDEGNRVRKGQVLARLDDADLASTVEELEARARYAQSQHERAENLVRQGLHGEGRDRSDARRSRRSASPRSSAPERSATTWRSPRRPMA